MAEQECPLTSAEDVLAYYQMELRAPKDQRNDYGKYNYRNIEGINDAFKRVQRKLWEQWGILTSLHFTIDVLCKPDDRNIVTRYVVAKLHTPFGDVESQMTVREPEQQAGMSPSQVSESASSYAKKYAASDLFAIGGEADPDELPPDATPQYPSEPFDAKCGQCGNVMHGFSAKAAQKYPCPTCGALDWQPLGPTPLETMSKRVAKAS